MKIAAAQTIPKEGNIKINLQDHCRLAELAADNGAQLVVFPEMSITGYQKELGNKLSFAENDSRLDVLRQLSAKRNIIIIAGAPIKISHKLYIGSFILSPDNSVLIYTKQFLHQGEEIFFSSSDEYNPILELDDERISLAICADITNPEHPANAGKNKSTLYIASIFYSPKGITEAYGQLSAYANQYSMNILMANYGGESLGSPSAGQSAFWDATGEIITSTEEPGERLMLVYNGNKHWAGNTLITSP
ncbi:MAG: carbon-nitrogen hydrolase family protein [Bacteroidetes bacterium]|nr:carbon-nitrogen hydrolase family protein [Bacteroidota bacterium]